MEHKGIKRSRTMQAEPDRSKANIEAEKGETILTSDEQGNRAELYHIEGEKHSNGGTPLAAQSGSAIYSDHLKLEDPALLQLFGFSGKKPKTFAELSKKHDPTKQQEELEKGEHIDNITRKSLEKTISDKLFKQSFAFLLQQTHQEKDETLEEHSELFEPALDRLGLSYEELVAGANLDDAPAEKPKADEVVNEPEMAEDGIEIEKDDLVYFDTLAQANQGDETKPKTKNRGNVVERLGEVFGEKDKDKILKYFNYLSKQVGLPEAKNANEIPQLIGVFQKYMNQQPELLIDYISSEDPNFGSSQPSNKMKSLLDNAAKQNPDFKKDGNEWQNKDISRLIKEGYASREDVREAYEDNLWWHRAYFTKKADADQVARYENEPVVAEIDGVKYKRDLDNPDIYLAFQTNADGTVTQLNVNKEVLDYTTPEEQDIKGLGPMQSQVDDYRFDWANKRALRAAKQAKRRIPYIRPQAQFTDTFFADQAYYNPDDAIAAIQSITGDLSRQQNIFSGPQQQAANQSQLMSNAFESIAQVMGNYADKNVDAYNRERFANTEIAQRSANLRTAQIDDYFNKNATLKQQYANSLSLAEQAIAAQEIGMHDRRKDRVNLQRSVGDQFMIDPNTGFHVFTGVGKPLDGADLGPKYVEQLIEIKKQFPDMDYNQAMTLVNAISDGKIKIPQPSTDKREASRQVISIP
jgi:hypothetical protein